LWSKNGQKRAEQADKDGELISIKQWNKDGSLKESLTTSSPTFVGFFVCGMLGRLGYA